mgnify:FL=1
MLFDQNEYEANSAPIQLESAVNGNLVFYPNPVEYELNVNWEELSSQSIVVEIRNMYSEVLSIQLLRKGDYLSMTSLPPGRYLLTVVGSEEETMSIIKR